MGSLEKMYKETVDKLDTAYNVFNNTEDDRIRDMAITTMTYCEIKLGLLSKLMKGGTTDADEKSKGISREDTN